MQNLPESPLSASAILGAGARLGLSVFGKLFLVTTALALVQFIPTLVLAPRFGNGVVTPQEMLSVQFNGPMFLLQLACLLALLLIQAVALTRLDNLATGVATGYPGEIRRGLRVFPSLVGAFLLSLLIGIAAMILAGAIGALIGLLGALLFGKLGFVVLLILVMLVMMFYVVMYLMFVQYSIVLEESGPIRAINRSFNLVYGHWWHAFVVLILGVLCLVAIAIVGAVAMSPLLLMTGSSDTGRSFFVSGVVQMTASAVLDPFILSVIYMLYRDLKLRSQLSVS
ncbi:MAG TPA: hypothetical protein VGH91_03610 [Gammaproteobacteria bacterium]